MGMLLIQQSFLELQQLSTSTPSTGRLIVQHKHALSETLIRSLLSMVQESWVSALILVSSTSSSYISLTYLSLYSLTVRAGFVKPSELVPHSWVCYREERPLRSTKKESLFINSIHNSTQRSIYKQLYGHCEIKYKASLLRERLSHLAVIDYRSFSTYILSSPSHDSTL